MFSLSKENIKENLRVTHQWHCLECSIVKMYYKNKNGLRFSIHKCHISYLKDCKFDHQNPSVIFSSLLNNKDSSLKFKKYFILMFLSY